MMAGYGFMLFFSASQATLSATAYPSFGFATVFILRARIIPYIDRSLPLSTICFRG
jgi:hypothetical protein